MDSVYAVVNIGRGATFGLSDTVANAITPGASCTVPQNAWQQALGGAATMVVGPGMYSTLRGIRAGYVAGARAIPQSTTSGRAAFEAREVLRETTRQKMLWVARKSLEAVRRGPRRTYDQTLDDLVEAGLTQAEAKKVIIEGAGKTNSRWNRFFFVS